MPTVSVNISMDTFPFVDYLNKKGGVSGNGLFFLHDFPYDQKLPGASRWFIVIGISNDVFLPRAFGCQTALFVRFTRPKRLSFTDYTVRGIYLQN